MKIKFLAPFIIVALSCSFFYSCIKENPSHPHPPTDSTGVDLKKGLLLYLPFTGNFADSSGNNNPTVGVSGATLANDQKGTAASALGGTGNGERVIVTNNGSIKFDTAYTLSMNVMLKSYQRSGFVNMVKQATGDGWVFGAGTDVGSTNVFNMNTVDTTGTCGTTVQPYNSQLLHSRAVLQPGTWYNIICVFRDGVSKIYVNGILDTTLVTNNHHVPVCLSSNIIVGGWWDGDPVSINGTLDEVRLYNRAINTQEIAKLAEGFPVQPSTPVADLKRGLLLYLPFNGSIADSSGNNNPTRIVGTGAGLTYDIHGYANSAYGSDGTSGRLEVTNNGSIQFDTAFTVSLSFMERANLPRQLLVSMVKVESGKGPSFGLGNSMPGQPNVWFGVIGSSGTCDDYAEGHGTTDTTDFIPQPESWYNLIGTFRKGILKVYLNGKLISQTTTSDPYAHVCPDAKLVVGGWWDNDPVSINGKIDNVRLYNRELNSDEIGLLSQYYQPTTNSVRQVVTH